MEKITISRQAGSWYLSFSYEFNRCSTKKLQLLQGIKLGIYGIVLNSDWDGIQQITQILRNYRGIETLHILSHGSSFVSFLFAQRDIT